MSAAVNELLAQVDSGALGVADAGHRAADLDLDSDSLLRVYAELLRRADTRKDTLSVALSGGLFASRVRREPDALRLLRHASGQESAPAVATDALRTFLASTVNRWHYRMLWDVARNGAYAAAIVEACAPFQGHPCVALDIGAGTGLLSMMIADALERAGLPPGSLQTAGQQTVYAVEASLAMCSLARITLARRRESRGAAPSVPIPSVPISLLPYCSCDLRIAASADDVAAPTLAASRPSPPVLPVAASLIVSEVLDSGLLGEGAMRTLRHAIRCLLAAPAVGGAPDARNVLPPDDSLAPPALRGRCAPAATYRLPSLVEPASSPRTQAPASIVPPHPRCIPEAATVWVQAVECPWVAAQSSACLVCCASRAAGLGADTSACSVSHAPAPVDCEEPYTCADLRGVPHTALGPPVAAAVLGMCPTVLPTETRRLRGVCHDSASSSAAPPPIVHVLQYAPRVVVRIPATPGRPIHAVVLWFDLHLSRFSASGGAGGITVRSVSSPPSSAASERNPRVGPPAACNWDHAIFYLPSRHALTSAARVAAHVDVALDFGDDALSVTLPPVAATLPPLFNLPARSITLLRDSAFWLEYVGAVQRWLCTGPPRTHVRVIDAIGLSRSCTLLPAALLLSLTRPRREATPPLPGHIEWHVAVAAQGDPSANAAIHALELAAHAAGVAIDTPQFFVQGSRVPPAPVTRFRASWGETSTGTSPRTHAGGAHRFSVYFHFAQERTAFVPAPPLRGLADPPCDLVAFFDSLSSVSPESHGEDKFDLLLHCPSDAVGGVAQRCLENVQFAQKFLLRRPLRDPLLPWWDCIPSAVSISGRPVQCELLRQYAGLPVTAGAASPSLGYDVSSVNSYASDLFHDLPPVVLATDALVGPDAGFDEAIFVDSPLAAEMEVLRVDFADLRHVDAAPDSDDDGSDIGDDSEGDDVALIKRNSHSVYSSTTTAGCAVACLSQLSPALIRASSSPIVAWPSSTARADAFLFNVISTMDPLASAGTSALLPQMDYEKAARHRRGFDVDASFEGCRGIGEPHCSSSRQSAVLLSHELGTLHGDINPESAAMECFASSQRACVSASLIGGVIGFSVRIVP